MRRRFREESLYLYARCDTNCVQTFHVIIDLTWRESVSILVTRLPLLPTLDLPSHRLVLPTVHT